MQVKRDITLEVPLFNRVIQLLLPFIVVFDTQRVNIFSVMVHKHIIASVLLLCSRVMVHVTILRAIQVASYFPFIFSLCFIW